MTVRIFFLQMMHMNCSYTMSDHDLVSYIIEENKRRKKRRIVLTELYFEFLLGFAYLSDQRRPRELGCFSDDECRQYIRKYLLKEMYDGQMRWTVHCWLSLWSITTMVIMLTCFLWKVDP